MSVGYTTAKRIQVLTGHKKGHVSGLATASEGVSRHRGKKTSQNRGKVKKFYRFFGNRKARLQPGLVGVKPKETITR